MRERTREARCVAGKEKTHASRPPFSVPAAAPSSASSDPAPLLPPPHHSRPLARPAAAAAEPSTAPQPGRRPSFLNRSRAGRGRSLPRQVGRLRLRLRLRRVETVRAGVRRGASSSRLERRAEGRPSSLGATCGLASPELGRWKRGRRARVSGRGGLVSGEVGEWVGRLVKVREGKTGATWFSREGGSLYGVAERARRCPEVSILYHESVSSDSAGGGGNGRTRSRFRLFGLWCTVRWRRGRRPLDAVRFDCQSSMVSIVRES